jgi:hypothetical protein
LIAVPNLNRRSQPQPVVIIKTPAAPRAWLDFLFRHPGLTFLVMGASFLLFGVMSVNLFVLLMANIRLFIEYGVMVIDDGALQQLAELLGLGALSALFYIAFAVCDRTLLRRLTGTGLRECSSDTDDGRAG